MRYQLNLFVLAKISLWTLAMGSRLGTWHMALPHKGGHKCVKFMRFQQPLALPGFESTDIEPIFNNAASFKPPRPTQKFNYVNYMFKGTEPPRPPNEVANATGSFDAVRVNPKTGEAVLYFGGLTITFEDDGSTLTAHGNFQPYVGGTLALTGGTGKYGHGVAGEAKFTDTSITEGPFKGRHGVDVQLCITKL